MYMSVISVHLSLKYVQHKCTPVIKVPAIQMYTSHKDTCNINGMMEPT